MKSTELKKMIKEAVKEAIQEELKEVLLEAVRAPKQSMPSPVVENKQTPPSDSTLADKRSLYEQALGETSMKFTSQNVPNTFKPQPGFDSTNGTLPQGELGLDQIANLLPK